MRDAWIVCLIGAIGCAAPAPQDGPPAATGPSPSDPGAIPAQPAPAPLSPEQCEADGECALTTSPGCCSCCPCAPIHAIAIEELKRQEERCAVIDCDMRCEKASTTCPKCVDPAAEGMAARCIDNICTLVER